MKRVICFILILFWTVSLSAQTVYITKTGTKYHSSEYRYLSQSKIAIDLKEAVKGYSPCSVCKPPTQIGLKTGTTSTEVPKLMNTPTVKSGEKQQPRATSAIRQQCQATTKAGTRCKRMADPGSRYCWQHQK